MAKYLKATYHKARSLTNQYFTHVCLYVSIGKSIDLDANRLSKSI